MINTIDIVYIVHLVSTLDNSKNGKMFAVPI